MRCNLFITARASDDRKQTDQMVSLFHFLKIKGGVWFYWENRHSCSQKFGQKVPHPGISRRSCLSLKMVVTQCVPVNVEAFWPQSFWNYWFPLSCAGFLHCANSDVMKNKLGSAVAAAARIKSQPSIYSLDTARLTKDQPSSCSWKLRPPLILSMGRPYGPVCWGIVFGQ